MRVGILSKPDVSENIDRNIVPRAHSRLEYWAILTNEGGHSTGRHIELGRQAALGASKGDFSVGDIGHVDRNTQLIEGQRLVSARTNPVRFTNCLGTQERFTVHIKTLEGESLGCGICGHLVDSRLGHAATDTGRLNGVECQRVSDIDITGGANQDGF